MALQFIENQYELGGFTPTGSVHATIIDCFCQVMWLDTRGALHISNCTGYLEYSVIGAGTQSEALHGGPEQLLT